MGAFERGKGGLESMPPTEQAAKVKWIFAVAALIFVIMLLHSHSYSGRNYREDEIDSVHAAMLLSPTGIVQWQARDVHPPGWRLFAYFWVNCFGGAEEITRWSSKLINLLTYALLYQLGLRIADRRTAFYAVAILGVYGFAASGMHELRPYSMLVMIAAALHLVYYRWLHRPTSRLMLVYAALGIAAIYTHFFAFFIFPAHALFLFAFRRFERKVWLNSLLMWGFIALSFSAWLLPFIYVILVPFPGGIYYSTPSLQRLYQQVMFRPEIIFGFLLLMSLFAPPLAIIRRHPGLRWRKHWPLLYPLFLLLATLIIAFLANALVHSLTARNLQMVVMLVALLMALGLRRLPGPAAAILLILLYLQAPQNIAVLTSNGPYREIVQSMKPTYQTDSLLITEFSWPFRWLLPASYYLMDFTPDKMSKARMFHLIDRDARLYPPAYPDKLANVHRSFDKAPLDSLPDHQQLWVLRQGGGSQHSEALQAWLHANYALLGSEAWDQPFPTSYRLSEYRRAPAHDTVIHAGDAMRLHSWTLLDSVEVQACQTVTIESWWQIAQPDATPHTLTLILADSDGDGQVSFANAIPADVFTSEWEADKYYLDQTELVIPCGIAAGSYDLLLAMKASMSGEALSFRYSDDSRIGREYYLTTLTAQGN